MADLDRILALLAGLVGVVLLADRVGNPYDEPTARESAPTEFIQPDGSINVDKLVAEDTTARDEFNMSPYR